MAIHRINRYPLDNAIGKFRIVQQEKNRVEVQEIISILSCFVLFKTKENANYSPDFCCLLVSLWFIHWIVIYPADSPIHHLYNWGLTFTFI